MRGVQVRSEAVDEVGGRRLLGSRLTKVAAKHDAKNQKALHEGASSEKGALSKFKAGAQIVIENDRLLRHAEDVLQRPETRVRPT